MSENVPKEATADALAVLQERARKAELAVERLRAELDTLSQRDRFAGPETQTLTRLVETLRWEDGPRALRIVLPLARLFRRGSALSRPASVAPGGQLAAASAAPASAVPGRRLSRRVLLAGYRLVRPVALPLAVRLHRVLTRLLQREAILAHTDPVPAAAGVSATAELLRSTEAAMLTLALRPRERA